MKTRQGTAYLKIISVCFVSLAGFFLFLFPEITSNTACAAEVTLAWDANSESNLAGYKLYYESENAIEFYGGTDANEGDSPITIHLQSLTDPDSPIYTVTGLEEATYYYFALTAFDSEGMESDFSDEVGTMAGSGGSGGGCFLTCGLARQKKISGVVAVVVVLLAIAILWDKHKPNFFFRSQFPHDMDGNS